MLRRNPKDEFQVECAQFAQQILQIEKQVEMRWELGEKMVGWKGVKEREIERGERER